MDTGNTIIGYIVQSIPENHLKVNEISAKVDKIVQKKLDRLSLNYFIICKKDLKTVEKKDKSSLVIGIFLLVFSGLALGKKLPTLGLFAAGMLLGRLLGVKEVCCNIKEINLENQHIQARQK